MRICWYLGEYISHRNAGNAYRNCLARLGVEIVEEPEEADIVVLHEEPHHYPGILERHPGIREKYLVGYAVWETDILPEAYRRSLQLVDEIWTCSQFSLDCLEGGIGKPTQIIPHVVEPIETDAYWRARLCGMIDFEPSIFYFYAISKLSDPRKNLFATLEAFSGLFHGDEAQLIVKTPAVPGPVPAALRRNVNFITGLQPAGMVGAIHDIGDVLVSSHCSEAWGLTISEAMATGNLAVATGFGGNMTFMTPLNSIPLDYEIAPIETAVLLPSGFWTHEMSWARVNRDDLRAKMRHCFDNRHGLSEIREQARRDMEQFRPDRVAALIGKRLDELRPEICVRATEQRRQTA